MKRMDGLKTGRHAASASRESRGRADSSGTERVQAGPTLCAEAATGHKRSYLMEMTGEAELAKFLLPHKELGKQISQKEQRNAC